MKIYVHVHENRCTRTCHVHYFDDRIKVFKANVSDIFPGTICVIFLTVSIEYRFFPVSVLTTERGRLYGILYLARIQRFNEHQQLRFKIGRKQTYKINLFLEK